MIRKLYFQNAAGDRWGLNGDRGVYAHALAGFGFTLSPSFADLGRGFFASVSDETEPQNTLPFTLTFTRNPYETYKTMMDWIAAAKTLTIVYSPVGTQEFYRDVSVNFVQKGEKNEVGWLEVPCSFFCRTPWYLPSPTKLNLSSAGKDNQKRYSYRYTKGLRYGQNRSASMSGTIAGAGHIPGSIELSYHGVVANPKIRLVGNISGKTYGVCSVATALSPTDTLKFSSRYENAYVKRIAAGGAETDLLDVLDLSSTPFFHVPVDEPCTISIESDVAMVGAADLLIFYYYRSV